MADGKPTILTPNNLTMGRLVLSAAVFVALGHYSPGPGAGWLLDVAAALFLVATLTDAVDGYLARKHGMQTSLGRLLDPFVDKVLICGTFVFLAGPNFTVGGRHVTDLASWMVVVVLARELLVTSLRGVSEAQGRAFAATIYGKVKMFLQSTAAMVIMITLAHFGEVRWAAWLRWGIIWLMVVFTVLSMLAYVSRYAALQAAAVRPAETGSSGA